MRELFFSRWDAISVAIGCLVLCGGLSAGCIAATPLLDGDSLSTDTGSETTPDDDNGSTDNGSTDSTPDDTHTPSETDSGSDSEPDADTGTDTRTIGICIGASKKVCGDSCVDVSTDTANCGDCDVSCDTDVPFCNGGTCSVCATTGQKNCGGGCIDVLADNANCGECGVECTDPETCQNGRCSSHCLSDWQNGPAATSCHSGLQADFAFCINVLNCLLANDCATIEACTSQNGNMPEDCNYQAPGTGWRTPTTAAWNAVCTN